MEDVVRRLENIIEDAHAINEELIKKSGPAKLSAASMARRLGNITENANASNEVLAKNGAPVTLTAASSPWRTSSRVATAMETFTSRIENVDLRTKLNELQKHVEADLGPQATDPHSGVYNPARLLRFLLLNDMNVADSRTSIVLNSNARHEFKMGAKRMLIVRDDLNFGGLPRWGELQKCQPSNPFIGRTKTGQVLSYINWGARCKFDALKKIFSVVEYIDGRSYNQSSRTRFPILHRNSDRGNAVIMYIQELSRILYDALSSVEASHVSIVSFYDFEGGSFGSLMGLMERELRRVNVRLVIRLGAIFLSIILKPLTFRHDRYASNGRRLTASNAPHSPSSDVSRQLSSILEDVL